MSQESNIVEWNENWVVTMEDGYTLRRSLGMTNVEVDLAEGVAM